MTPSRPAQQDADDYEAILAAVMETARGRWFIAEYARRNRHAETVQLLDALRRIERRVAANADRLAHPDLADLAAIFGLDGEKDGEPRPAGGLTADLVADIARETGAAAETIREQALSARGALKSLAEAGADPWLCGALDRAMNAIDRSAATQGDASRTIGSLAGVVGAVRERVQQMLDDGPARRSDPAPRPEMAPEHKTPAHETPAHETPAHEPPAHEPPKHEPPKRESFSRDAASPSLPGGRTPTPLFQHRPPEREAAAAVARPMLPASGEERALRELIARPDAHPAPAAAPPAGGRPRTLAELDRLSYEQRYALFAS